MCPHLHRHNSSQFSTEHLILADPFTTGVFPHTLCPPLPRQPTHTNSSPQPAGCLFHKQACTHTYLPTHLSFSINTKSSEKHHIAFPVWSGLYKDGHWCGAGRGKSPFLYTVVTMLCTAYFSLLQQAAQGQSSGPVAGLVDQKLQGANVSPQAVSF